MDVTGLGQSTVAEDEDAINTVEEGEEISDTDAFWAIWNLMGESLLEDTEPADLADFIEVFNTAASVEVELVAYSSDEDEDGFELYTEVEFESEPGESVIDDLEGCECGDSDERD